MYCSSEYRFICLVFFPYSGSCCCMAAIFSFFFVWLLITAVLCLLRDYLRKQKHSYVWRNAGWELR